MYKVFKVQDFDKYANKIFQKQDIRELNIFIENLKKNPFLGKPLSYNFLREKKLGDKRVYFLVYKEICLILFVATSNKKMQQITIDYIKKDLEEYKKYAYELHERLNN